MIMIMYHLILISWEWYQQDGNDYEIDWGSENDYDIGKHNDCN